MITSKPRVDWLITQMRIRGGAEAFTLTILPYLKQRYSIRLITLIADDDYSPKLQSQGIQVFSLGVKSKIDFLSIIPLIRLWKTEPPDILHTHLYHAGILGRVLGRACHIKRIYCHQAGPEFDRSKIRSFIDRITSPLVDSYTVSCKAVGEVLHTREKISEEKITIIPNAYENTPSPPPPRQRTENQTFSLISIGRLEPEKNHTLLIKALALIKEIPCFLTILGEGSLLDALKAQAANLSLAERIDFRGFTSDVTPWLINSDVFILPSKWEGISIALLQAMGKGLCVIATNTGGTPEVITHGENGLLVPPDDHQALADAIVYLYQHPDIRLKLGLNAQKFVSQNYSIEATVNKLDRLYQKAIPSSESK